MQYYDSGRALFQQGLYNEALIELHRAEDAFRELDARGHPFTNPLSNRISGLANSLALSGDCCRELGNYNSAVTYYETSLINAKFEKKSAFRVFYRQISRNMAFCYEKIAEANALPEPQKLAEDDLSIDVSFRFPFSLPPDLIAFARLYQLSPERFARYGNFFRQARQKDAEIRHGSKTSDDSIMKRMSIYIWSILFMIWAVYGLIAIDALYSARR